MDASEVYRLLAFNAMFQITLIASLLSARSNNNKGSSCHIWWIPFTLSAIVSLGTAGLLAHKFVAHLQKKEATLLDLESQRIIPPLSHIFKFKVFLWCLRRYWSAAALAFLFIAFSLVVLVSCNAILC
eukprot:Gb_28223 [translate_table: standard]